MRGGTWIGLVLATALACGSGKTDDFGDAPERRSEAGTGGTSSAGMGGSVLAVCAPGSTQACLGPGQCAGAQRCSAVGDAWGECDCGAGASGNGGTDPAGKGGQGAAGGATGHDGTDNAGADNGGTDNGGKGSGKGGASNGKGGTSGGGGKAGGSAGEACDTDFCDAYCDAATGHCAMDGSSEDCMTQCTETRCTTQAGCLDEGAEYFTCIADSTPVCIADRSLPGDGDCRDAGEAFFDCLVVPWHCDDDGDACICSRTRDSTAPAGCPTKYKCCVATVSGTACGCDNTEFCEDLGPGYIKTDHCPL